MILAALSLITDASFGMGIFFLLSRLIEGSLLPSPSLTLFSFSLFILVEALSFYLTRKSLGSFIWQKNDSSRDATHFITSSLVCLIFMGLTPLLILSSPDFQLLLSVAPNWRLTEWSPPPSSLASSLPSSLAEAENSPRFELRPFFYLLGYWPTRYQGDPIFHSTPYRKGPPHRHLDQIIARWELPAIQIQIQGPRTPSHPPTQQSIKQCITHLELVSIPCWRIRKELLWGNKEDMGVPASSKWTVRWFDVQPLTYSPKEKPSGVFLEAQTKSERISRFIFIHPNGRHQALTFKSRPGSSSENAYALFLKVIRSQRQQADLKSVQDLSLHQLSALTTLDLGNFQTSSPDSSKNMKGLTHRLSDLQAALLSRISVKPSDYEAYYHLAGISLTLARHIDSLRFRAKTHPDQFSEILETDSDVSSTPLLLKLDEWSAVAKPIVRAAYQYAKDVNSKHKLSAELERIFSESKDYQ